MKVNYHRAILKQREAAAAERAKQREEFLNGMTLEEREAYLEKEHKEAMEALSFMSTMQSYLGDAPYSKLWRTKL